MYGINEIFISQQRNDYSEHLSDFEYKLDCSLGTNPYGLAPEVNLIKNDISILSEYPHSDENLKLAICDNFKRIANLTKNNINLTLGSMGGLIALDRILLKENKKVIGIAPQFSAVVDDFITYKVDYDPVYLKPENNFKFCVDDMLKKINENNDAFIYIDNPNNPTGQIFDIDDIEKIIIAAEKNNSFILIDEAYGDYMDDENSAIKFINKYKNLAVARTFSKGLGLAGIRLGYVISQPYFSKILQKAIIPFSVSTLSEKLALQILNSKENWAKVAAKKSEILKPKIRQQLTNIKVGFTSDCIPIAMYYVDDENINLEEKFQKVGLKVVTCEGYDGLGQNYVRINLNKDEEILLNCYKKINTLLNK